jgi:hypothetical protein
MPRRKPLLTALTLLLFSLCSIVPLPSASALDTSFAASEDVTIESDDFNSTTLHPRWTFVDPRGDSTLTLNGTNALIAVPAGTDHDIWTDGNYAARLMQPANDVDFEIEAKFESVPVGTHAKQGLLVEASSTAFLRFDVVSTDNAVDLFAATFEDGAPTVRLHTSVASSNPLYLRITRASPEWTLSHSVDAETWTTAVTFSHAMTVSAVGVFAGNAAENPAFTASVDYFFNTASPIDPEDPIPPPPPPPPPTSTIESDDFNSTTLDPRWTFVDPRGDSTLALDGLHALISVPAWSEHDLWQGGNYAARLMQPANDVDFEIEAKFESVPSGTHAMQGLLVESTPDTFLRLDVVSTGDSVNVFAASIENNAPTLWVNESIAGGNPLYLRITRAGNSWTLRYGYDGENWTVALAMAHTMTVTAVGVFAGNAGDNPAFTASVDYFFNTASPIDPEDPLPPPGDTTPPTVGIPALAFEASMLPTTDAIVPLTASWAATDLSGIGSYDVEQSLDGGPWTALLTGTTQTSHGVTIASSATVQLRVRARDVPGNTSEWVESVIYQPLLVQEPPAAEVVSYSGAWNVLAATEASGGTFRRSPHATASVTFTFTGSQVAWVGPTGTNYGIAQLYLDGALVQEVNLYSPSSQWRRVLYTTQVSEGPHTLEVRVKGQRSAPSTANNVGVDAFVVLSVSGSSSGGDGDDTPPVVNIPALAFSATALPTTGPSVPLTGSWSATDDVGVASYDVELATNGTWSPFLTGTTQVTTTLTVASGDTVQLRVRARDAAGNTSDWVESDSYTATLLQEPPLTGVVSYGGAWNVLTATDASGGGFRRSPHASASVTVTFTGTEIVWVGPTGTNYGIAQVYLDGVLVGQVDPYSPAAQWRRVLYSAQVAHGTHTFEVRVLGQRSASSTANNVGVDAFVVLAVGSSGGGSDDTTPPVVALPTIAFATTQLPDPSSTVPLVGSWSATDDVGVASYDVEVATNGTWASLLTGTIQTSASLTATSGDTVRLRVRAHDGAGNTSDWVESASFTATLAQELPVTGVVSYAGAWNVLVANEASGGGFRRSPHATASVTVTFTGTAISWVAPVGTNYGLAQVYLDGVLVGQVDLYSTTTRWRQVVYTVQVAEGTHTLEIRGTGQRNPSSSANNIGIDAFVINGILGSP